MPIIKKELYNHSYEDLVKQSDVSPKYLQLESKRWADGGFFCVCAWIELNWESFCDVRLCRSAMEIYRAAQSAELGGDEELAFIMYMRYCNIIKSLQKKPDYRLKQAELSQLFGGNQYVMLALDTAEILRKSLLARYDDVSCINSPFAVNSISLSDSKNGTIVKNHCQWRSSAAAASPPSNRNHHRHRRRTSPFAGPFPRRNCSESLKMKRIAFSSLTVGRKGISLNQDPSTPTAWMCRRKLLEMGELSDV